MRTYRKIGGMLLIGAGFTVLLALTMSVQRPNGARGQLLALHECDADFDCWGWVQPFWKSTVGCAPVPVPNCSGGEIHSCADADAGAGYIFESKMACEKMWNVCGDGLLYYGNADDASSATEECDFGVNNGAALSFCNADCTVPVCGNGVPESSGGEECESDSACATGRCNTSTCACCPALETLCKGNPDFGKSCAEFTVGVVDGACACVPVRNDCASCESQCAKGPCAYPDTCGTACDDCMRCCAEDGRPCGLSCEEYCCSSAGSCIPSALESACAPSSGRFVSQVQCERSGCPVPELAASLLPGACGDGLLHAGEACDDGPANGEGPQADCRGNCTKNLCGNRRLEAPEECDDGNRVHGDGCSEFCVSESGIRSEESAAPPMDLVVAPMPSSYLLAALSDVGSRTGAQMSGLFALLIMVAGVAGGISAVRHGRRHRR